MIICTVCGVVGGLYHKTWCPTTPAAKRPTPIGHIREHVTTTFRAECECGEWWSHFRDARHEAEEDLMRHRDAAHGGKP